MKLFLLALVASAAAEDFTDTPFRWPDMLRNGGRIVQVLTSDTNPRPSKINYPRWYDKYPMRFVEDIPTPPGEEVAGGEIVVLEYDITDKMGYGFGSVKQVADTFGFLGQALKDKMSPKHNELGLIAKAADGRELGRYAFSLWPIGNDEIEDPTNDMRQKPRVIDDKLVVLNRAVLSVELSKANSWWGLPSDTKQIHVANLNKKQYKAALAAIKEYAEKTQYFNDYEIINDGPAEKKGKHVKLNVAMPPVTCNTMVEHVVNRATGNKVFDQGMAKIGYLNLHLKENKPLKKTVPTKIVQGLMANKHNFNEHYNKDMYIVPAYYDKAGNPRPGMMRDDPEEWYVIWTSDVNWRQNYPKADRFQTKYGFKSAVTEEGFDHASDADPNQNQKYVSNPEAEKKNKKKRKSLLQTPKEEEEVKLMVKQIEQEQDAGDEEKPKPKIEAWYLNMDEHTDRKECMETQLREHGFEPHRESAVIWPHGGAASIAPESIKKAGLADCIPAGINTKTINDHMNMQVPPDQLRANILSNYCGHKRLIEKLAKSNSTADYFLIFEDDAQLKPWFRVILDDFVQNYKGDWSAVQIDPFQLKSNQKSIKKGIPTTFKGKNIYHGGIMSGIQTLLVKKERINEIVDALNKSPAMPADHIGRHVDSMVGWKPYISTHPGWYGEQLNEKCDKSVKYSRIGRTMTETAKFLAQEGFGDVKIEEEQVDDSMEVNPEDNGRLSVLKTIA